MGLSLPALLDEFVLYIYRLQVEGLAWAAAFAGVIFCVVFRRYAGLRWLRLCIGTVLGVWFAAVLWMTVLGRESGGYGSCWIPLHTYRDVINGGNRELMRSAYMNALLFFPAGLLLGSLMAGKGSPWRNLLRAGTVFAVFSLAIELCQYRWGLGNAEIDDILHNTLGAVIGAGMAQLRWRWTA